MENEEDLTYGETIRETSEETIDLDEFLEEMSDEEEEEVVEQSTPEERRAFEKEQHKEKDAFVLTREFYLEEPYLAYVQEALLGTPFEDNVEKISALKTKINDEGHFGAHFVMYDYESNAYIMEIVVDSMGINMYFKET